MMMSADYCAINHLKLIWRDPCVVQRIQDILPQSRQSPAAELTVDRGPLAKLFGQITPWRTSPCVALRLEPMAACAPPENSIQNKTMVCGFPPVRVPDGTNEALEEGPLIVGYQVACQIHPPRRDELES